MSKPRLTLEKLLKAMESGAPRSEEDQVWLDMRPIGGEILPDEEESWLR